jgi:hypothetical protein
VTDRTVPLTGEIRPSGPDALAGLGGTGYAWGGNLVNRPTLYPSSELDPIVQLAPASSVDAPNHVLILTQSGRVYHTPNSRDFISDDLVAGLPQGHIINLQVSLSSLARFALDEYGNLWAWSTANNFKSAVGVGTPGYPYIAPTPTPFVTLTDVNYVVPGPVYVMARKTDGSWWASGYGPTGLPFQLLGQAGQDSQNDPARYGWLESEVFESMPSPIATVVTAGTGLQAQNGYTAILICEDGSAFALGALDTLFSGASGNVTGINYQQYLSYATGTLTIDPVAYDPIPLPWAAGIQLVDASIDAPFGSSYGLYLDADGIVHFVDNETWVFISQGQSPPQVIMPEGVIATGLYVGGAGIIGSDTKLYTLGAPDGSLTEDDILSDSDGHLSVDELFGTYSNFNSLAPGAANRAAIVFDTSSSPASPIAVSANPLTNVLPGGYAAMNTTLYAIVASLATLLGPTRAVPLFAFLSKNQFYSWARLVGPI